MIKFIRYTKNSTGRAFMALISKTDRYSRGMASYKYISKKDNILFMSDNMMTSKRAYNKLYKMREIIYLRGRLESIYFAGDLSRLQGGEITRLGHKLNKGLVVGYCSSDMSLSLMVKKLLSAYNFIDLRV